MKKEDFELTARTQLNDQNPELVEDFLNYWTEVPINGVKMRFEYEKKFFLKRRFATWRSFDRKFNKPNPVQGTLLAHDETIKTLTRNVSSI